MCWLIGWKQKPTGCLFLWWSSSSTWSRRRCLIKAGPAPPSCSVRMTAPLACWDKKAFYLTFWSGVLLCVSVSLHHLLRSDQHHRQQQVCCSIKAFLGFAGFYGPFIRFVQLCDRLCSELPPRQVSGGTLWQIQPSRSIESSIHVSSLTLSFLISVTTAISLLCFWRWGPFCPRLVSALPYFLDCCGPEVLSAC